MKKYFSIIALTILIILTGCRTAPGGIPADPGKDFTLAAGETAVITGENLKITFIEVVEDSRCPEGAICIWAGRASCLVDIVSGNNPPYRMALVQPGTSDTYAEDTYLTYKLAFRILPYPVVGKQIDPKEYRLQMAVNK